MTRKRILLAATAMLFPLGQSVALAGPYKGRFTGLFYGQGEGCWGGLYIREKTIQWYPGNLVCSRTAYTIVQQDLHTPFEKYDHIVFKLHHLSRGCPFHYVGLYYSPDKEAEQDAASSPPGTAILFYEWDVIGFDDYGRYIVFPYKRFIDGKMSGDELSTNGNKNLYCSLPYYGKPFPYGIPQH